jgi:hypothetical protein
MGRRGDMTLLTWDDKEVDAAELMAGWHYQLINSGVKRAAAERVPCLVIIVDIT